MATFEYEPWVTGEVITAEKLNSRGKPIVHLTEEDETNGWSIMLEPNLSETFLIDILFFDSSDKLERIIKVVKEFADGQDEANYKLIIDRVFDPMAIYNISTGELFKTSSEDA